MVDTAKNAQVNLSINNDSSESGQSEEDDLIKDIANDFSAMEKTGPPIGKNWLTINNVLLNSLSREKLVQKLEKHSLKIKKCNPEIWSKMLQSKRPDPKVGKHLRCRVVF